MDFAETYEINGTTYTSIDDVPEPDRSRLEAILESHGDAIADAASKAGRGAVTRSVKVVSTTSAPTFVARDEAGDLLADEDGNGIPDIFENVRRANDAVRMATAPPIEMTAAELEAKDEADDDSIYGATGVGVLPKKDSTVGGAERMPAAMAVLVIVAFIVGVLVGPTF